MPPGQPSKLTVVAKRFFTFYFDIWYVPIIFFALTVAITMLNDVWKNEILFYASYKLLGLVFLGWVASTIYNFVLRRWLSGILSVVILFFFFLYCFLYTIAGILGG